MGFAGMWEIKEAKKVMASKYWQEVRLPKQIIAMITFHKDLIHNIKITYVGEVLVSMFI